MRCPACGQNVEDRLIVYPSGFGALIDGEPVPMSPRQAQILEVLSRNLGHVILAASIGEIIGCRAKTVKVHVAALRKAIYRTKLVVDGKKGPGNGYWLRWLPER